MNEQLYIAGPMCFYPNGYAQWEGLRAYTQSMGVAVSLPNDAELNLNHEDLRLNADEIFKNCCDSMNKTTAIIANLEFFRGPEPDGGTVYEIGMAFAKGARCYAYTRDNRAMVWKYQGAELKNNLPHDRAGRVLPFYDLPFSPNLVSACKIVEGNYTDCLHTMIADITEEQKNGNTYNNQCPTQRTMDGGGQPLVYIAGPERYSSNTHEIYKEMKNLCANNGLTAITPLDPAPGIIEIQESSPLSKAQNQFRRNIQHVYNSDIIIANLNDFHGYEPESDTSFECGMGFQLGKKMFGYMHNTQNMNLRIPNTGANNGYMDVCGCTVENFDYPLNLMFSSSMPLYAGSFANALQHIVQSI